jgi:dTDP-glucose pyrophosphorylase
MNRWREVVVAPTTRVLDVLATIDRSALQIALVVDPVGKLLGTVTDGDVRRAILRSVPLDGPIESVMNRQPAFAHEYQSAEAVRAAMAMKRLRQMPVLNADGILVGLVLIDDRVEKRAHANWVVLMAGGDGVRLRPLTEAAPKPLLRVGNKPLLETILERFAQHGFGRFFMSVRYKADMIKEHFGDGSRWGVDVQYLSETNRLGTAGALSLLPERPSAPLIVMNGDVLTNANFNALIDAHTEGSPAATTCVREYEFTVPYGVAKLDGHQLVSIEEKPAHRFFVNAGIYVLEPHVIDLVVPNETVDMPTVLHRLVGNGSQVNAYPIREYWQDIGRAEDLIKADGDYASSFSKIL